MFFLGKTASITFLLSNDGWSRWWNSILGKFVQYFSIFFFNFVAVRLLMHADRSEKNFRGMSPSPVL